MIKAERLFRLYPAMSIEVLPRQTRVQSHAATLVPLYVKERERLLRWAHAASNGAVIGVLGQPGSGKTSFVQALAESIASERAVPLLLIQCRDRRLSAVLRESVCRAAPDLPLAAELEDAMLAQFRSVFATRPAVLVFDDLNDVELLGRLALPGVLVLVTSRAHALAVPFVELRELPADEAIALLARESGALLGDLALAKISTLMQRSPLALGLIAAVLAASPNTLPSDLLRLLNEEYRRLQRLTMRDDLKLVLDTALSFAYHRLSVSAQRVLRQLSVIPDAFAIELASLICDDAAVVLPELVRRKLLQFNSGTGRYAWLPTVRAFVRERLASSESVAAELRHAQGVVALARAISGDVAVHNIGGALRAFDALRLQIDAAFWRLQPDSHALKLKAARVLIALYGCVEGLLPLRFTPREQAAWLSALVSAHRALENTRGEMQALGQLAAFQLANDDVAAALLCYERVQRLSKEHTATVPTQREPLGIGAAFGQVLRTLSPESLRG
jgi:hypothetical protein